MHIHVRTDDGEREIVVPEGTTLRGVAKIAKANPQTVVQMVNGKVAHPDSPLAEGDQVELQGVIYGG